ncbi:DUF6609 family protein [Priestia filamentosa]|uniref:DUF6609 family protein n=1 Tax=Priestia filamentosa TaxID=1402861 RepID=UPI000E758B9C|nr:DUF6609 family protein [Priestia filamentosa]RJS64139.1 hypothetical protein CJ485_05090 [Priestia filamentosa]WCM17668.1 hypothetical protein PGN40_10040 [Priestia filamentosa]
MSNSHDKKDEFNTQRTCGLWLIYIGFIIIFSALVGDHLLIQPFILGIGYFIGFLSIFVLPFVNQKLAFGKNTKFQDRMDNLSTVLNVLLCTACGLLIGFDDLRLFWLSIFIAVGIHFFGFYFSQGKMMILLGILTIINGVIGILLISIPFILFALIDGILKLLIGLKMITIKRTVNVIPQDSSSKHL